MRIQGYLNKGFKQICADQYLYIYTFSVTFRDITLEEYIKIKRE